MAFDENLLTRTANTALARQMWNSMAGKEWYCKDAAIFPPWGLCVEIPPYSAPCNFVIGLTQQEMADTKLLKSELRYVIFLLRAGAFMKRLGVHPQVDKYIYRWLAHRSPMRRHRRAVSLK